MKKLLRFADCLVLLAAIIGCLLRIWLQNAIAESSMLVSVGTHPAWILLCVFSGLTAVFIWLMTRHAGEDNRYMINFPRSASGMTMYLLLAIALGYTGIMDLLEAEELLEQVQAVAAMLSAVMLATAGIERFRGARPVFFLHMIPCVYLALRMLLLGREFGADPHLPDFLFTFLASVSLIPAFYWLWAFDVKMGSRKQSLFWSLLAAYFCMIASFDSNVAWAVHILFAACLLGNLCVQKNLPQPESATVEAVAVEENSTEESLEEASVTEESVAEPATKELRIEEIPAEEASAEEVPTEEPVEEAPAAPQEPELDMDTFLADLKRYLENENV